MTDKAAKALKLTAIDQEGLGVLSACVQDALTRVGEMVWQRKERRFVLTANRYMWEVDREAADSRREGSLHYRIRSGLHFDGVLGVQSQDLMQEDRNGWVSLLAIEAEGGDDNVGDGAGNLFLTLVFAAGARIRLEVECIDCVLTDMDDPWTTQARPDHELDAQAEGLAADPIP